MKKPHVGQNGVASWYLEGPKRPPENSLPADVFTLLPGYLAQYDWVPYVNEGEAVRALAVATERGRS